MERSTFSNGNNFITKPEIEGLPVSCSNAFSLFVNVAAIDLPNAMEASKTFPCVPRCKTVAIKSSSHSVEPAALSFRVAYSCSNFSTAVFKASKARSVFGVRGNFGDCKLTVNTERLRVSGDTPAEMYSRFMGRSSVQALNNEWWAVYLLGQPKQRHRW